MFKINKELQEQSIVMEFEEISFKVGPKKILKEVSHNLKEGCFYSIAGCNGSGKTTLLQTLLQIKKASSGKIYLQDKVENNAHYFSYVPQNTQLEFDFTVEEVVMMGRYPYYSGITGPGKEDKEKVKQALKLTDIEHLSKRLVTTLSGGERQRAIIARALAQDTPIMFLDEPVSQLDIYHQLEVLNLLREIVDTQNKTIVTVLHDLNQVSKFTDEVMVMDNGEIAAYGPPHEVLSPSLLKEIFRVNAEWIYTEDHKPHLVFHYHHNKK
ncbi:ABC transporter ATP-binding protein [Plebeiibacterium sediminum]|uniref:ABC transporter ATP-binding protein n=1 Tax=Plebeiibacterium sediminum TaxID=2992112 RepID=A0AAE3M369_9BACT|nr:ABC transporter ATP-binding protein [Plebeiobacterium sediminum]MCW3785994.1 ABC transporter ATP-binding protein [Plebeiobacterium sediminum]